MPGGPPDPAPSPGRSTLFFFTMSLTALSESSRVCNVPAQAGTAEMDDEYWRIPIRLAQASSA